MLSIGATLLLASVGTASAATTHSNDSSPSGPASGMVYYPLGVTLTNPTTTTVTGTASSGGCAYSESGAGSASVTSVEIEVAENPATCTAQFETGTPTNLAAGTAEPSGSLDTNASASSTATPASGDPSIYQDNQWLDPFGIQVNAQQQWLNWGTGGCVGSWSASSKWSWYNDGWSKLSGHMTANKNCSRALNSAYSSFDNALFCTIITGQPGAVTFTYFGKTNASADNLTGYNNGRWAWNYNDAKSGGCNNLLHHGHKFS